MERGKHRVKEQRKCIKVQKKNLLNPEIRINMKCQKKKHEADDTIVSIFKVARSYMHTFEITRDKFPIWRKTSVESLSRLWFIG